VWVEPGQNGLPILTTLSKIDHVQSSRFRPTNLVESTLTKIWMIRPWLKCGHIWPSQLWPKFGQVGSGQNLVVLGKISSGRNSVKSSQVDLDWNFVKSTLSQIWSRRPRPKFVRKSSKFISCWNLVSLAPTKNLPNSIVSTLWTQGLQNLIWIYFMKNVFWILNLIQIFRYGFKLDLNIWIWIFKKSNLLFKKNSFGLKI